MPKIIVKENENVEFAIRRFKRMCEKAGIIAEVKRKEFYEKPTWERKRKKNITARRIMKSINRFKLNRKRMY